MPLAGVVRFPNVMTVHASFPARTVPEFIASANANPGKLNHGSSGRWTTQHLAGELFKMMTGVSFVHVPLPRRLASTRRFARRPRASSVRSPAASIEHIKSGSVRGLAVTTASRSPALPDVPTVGEL
jgi:tripartite-type tricarboxylate transporter receptor subunit TctC